MNDTEQLDDAKRRFLAAKTEIEELRNKIAQERCPLFVGERITISDNGRVYDGVVEHIAGVPGEGELFEPLVGIDPAWAVCGHRIRKTDGAVSKWSFSLRDDEVIFRDGKWVKAARGIEAFLGLAPRFPE